MFRKRQRCWGVPRSAGPRSIAAKAATKPEVVLAHAGDDRFAKSSRPQDPPTSRRSSARPRRPQHQVRGGSDKQDDGNQYPTDVGPSSGALAGRPCDDQRFRSRQQRCLIGGCHFPRRTDISGIGDPIAGQEVGS